MLRAARLVLRAFAFGVLRSTRAAERVCRRLAAATFTRAELDALSVREWEAFGDDGPAAAYETFPWETEFFKVNIRPGDSILVVGAGSGRDVLPLLEAGHEVMALDIAPRALGILAERARVRGLNVATVHASIVDAPLPRAAFDAVLFSWFCFGYLRGADERRRALVNASASMHEGGRILLSFPLRREADAASSSPSVLARWTARLLGGIEPEQGDQFIVSGTAFEPGLFFTHSFDPAEIQADAERAGLVVLVQSQPTSEVGVAVLTRHPVASR